MAKRTRTTYSDAAKKDLIKKFKQTYIRSGRRSIKDEEEFDSLSLDEQWKIIYQNYVSKGKVKLSAQSFDVTTLKDNLKTFKSKIDDLDDKVVEDVLSVFADLTVYHGDKPKRTIEQRRKAAEKALKAKEAEAKKAAEELARIEEEAKALGK